MAETIRTHDCSIVLQRVEGPEARELFLHCQPPAAIVDPGLQAAAMYRAILGVLEAEGGGFGSVVVETIFPRDIQANIEPVRAARHRALAAHAAVQPVLKEYASKISCWRFHRRAARDGAGHQFSFLFYTDPGTAAEIIGRMEDSSIVREASTAGIIERIVIDDPTNPSKPGIEDTSDRNWSPALQRIWPVYIMGVSSLWLGLINEAMVEVPGTGDGIHGLLERYRQAGVRINSIWYKEGQHALLHHLNAIFGYKPMLLRKEMSF